MAHTFGGDTWCLLVVEVAYGIRRVLGGVLVVIWVGFRREITTVAVSIAAMGLIIMGLGTLPKFWMFVIVMGLLGVVFAYIQSTLLVFIQHTCDSQHLGKVMFLLMMLNTAIIPIEMVLFGPLADQISLWIIMVIGGFAQLVTGIGMLLHPKMRSISMIE